MAELRANDLRLQAVVLHVPGNRLDDLDTRVIRCLEASVLLKLIVRQDLSNGKIHCQRTVFAHG